MAEDLTGEGWLRALLALAVDEREARIDREAQLGAERPRRTELLLAEAGLPAAEIAQLTGRNAAAVRMTLSRARRAPGGKRDG